MLKINKLYHIVPLLALTSLTLPSSANDDKGEWTVGTGIDFSSGSYGDEVDTDILYIPVNLEYSRESWEAKVTVPWIRIEGPGSVIGGGDAGVITDRDEAVDASGIGDIWAQGTYFIDAIPPEWFYLDLVGKVKFPTADDEKGLGTGEFDYTLQLDFFKPIGKFSPMATVAYKIKGDPDEYEIDNVFYVSVGADYRFNDTFNFGATLDYQEASTSASDDALEVFSYLGCRISDASLLTVYGYAGLTDGSPDAGGGLQYKYTF